MSEFQKESFYFFDKKQNSDKEINSKKFESDYQKNAEDHRKYVLLMFEKLLNNKNKFSLDNHFDRKNSQKFLNEKAEYLSEIVLEDDVSSLNEVRTEKNNSKKDLELSMPNSPNKFTFGQI